MRLDYREAKLAGDVISEGCRAQFWDGQAASGDDQRFGTKKPVGAFDSEA